MKNRQRLFRISLILVASVFLVSSCVFINARIQESKARSKYEKLQELARQNDDSNSDSKEQESDGEQTAEEKRAAFPIHFPELQKENSDIIAWLTIPDTPVDYPILCNEKDDTFYLNHSADKSISQPGALFIESINKKDFSDSNTVIYGHNQRDHSMFGSLHKFADSDYFNTHPELIVYTCDFRKLRYTIFSCSQISNTHILSEPDMNKDNTVFQSYLEEILKGSAPKQNLRPDITLTSANKIITLSTCESGGQDSRRFVVQAVLISEEQF
ncbi:MAG: class B sortase [Blautia sp.]